MDYKKGTSRDQLILFNECVDNLIGKDNPVRIIDAYIDSLDLAKLGFKEPRLKTGAPPYSNKVLLKIYMYGYMDHTRSSRRLRRECKRNKEMIWLTENLVPSFKTIADFRKNNREGIKNVFKEFLFFCNKMNLLAFETVAIDGTKLRAQNSINNIYKRSEIDNVRLKIKKKITEYLSILDEEDKKEDNLKLKDDQVEKIVKKLKNAINHQEKVEKIKEEFENNENLKTVFDTDRDSRFQSDKGKIRAGYNPQIAGDSKHNLLIANDVTNQSNDLKQMTPMLKKVKSLKDELGVFEKTNALFDSGYFNEVEIMSNKDDNDLNLIVPSVAQAKEENDKCRSKKSKSKIPVKEFEADKFTYNPEQDIFICPKEQILIRKDKTPRTEPSGKRTIDYQCKQCNHCDEKQNCTKSKIGRTIKVSINLDEMKSFMERINSDPNKSIFSKRKEIIEHPFGTLKRNWGYTYFMQKGLEKVKSEFSFMCFVYNFKRVMNIMKFDEILQAIRG